MHVNKAIMWIMLLMSCSFQPGWTQAYDELAFQGYLLYSKEVATKDYLLFKQAASLLEKAAYVTSTNKEPLLWDAAMIAAMSKDTSLTLTLLEQALQAGLTDVHKVRTSV